MANSEFRSFVINNKASAKRSTKGLTMPSKEDHKRIAAHKIIEQRREEQELERMYDLNYY